MAQAARSPRRKAHSKSTSCNFCTFVQEHTRDNHKIFEDEHILVILDDFPIAEGHTLVILKQHREDLVATTEAEASKLGTLCAQGAKALQRACGVPKVYLASLSEEVQHVHYHLVPRYEADQKGFVHFLGPRKPFKDGEELAARIRRELVPLLT